MQVERPDNRYFLPYKFTDSPSNLRLWPRDVPHSQGAMEREIDTIHRHFRTKVVKDELHKVFEALLRIPASRRTSIDIGG
jgi:hypothetical protein